MAIRVLAVGKKHESWVKEGIERYEKRLHRPYDTEWVLVPHSAREGAQARQEESERIMTRLVPDEFVILLDERGELLDSPTLSRLLEARPQATIIIGGAYGVNDTLRARANRIVSLSPLVFPHQLVRLILIEQLYRAQSISLGAKYHHE